MNLEYLLIFTTVIGLVLFLFQRTEPKKRLIVVAVMFVPALWIRNWIVYRDLEQEGWIALILAVLLNFFFWVFIGRYNPVQSSDEIRVLGLDD
jgi:signal transduction histidine kinase